MRPRVERARRRAARRDRLGEPDAEQQAAAPHLGDRAASRARGCASRSCVAAHARRSRPARRARSRRARRSRSRSRAGCRRRCCRGGRRWNSSDAAPKVTRAPIGTPPPMPLASAIASGSDARRAGTRTTSPVRPAPVWISSRISSAPCAVVSSRARREVAVRAGRRRPASPLIGSTTSAATSSSIAASSASIVPSMCSTPPGSGSNGSRMRRLAGERERAHGAAVERVRRARGCGCAPPPSFSRASLNAASIASAPELPKNTRPPSPAPVRRLQPLGQLELRLASRSSWRRARASPPGARRPRRTPGARGRAR